MACLDSFTIAIVGAAFADIWLPGGDDNTFVLTVTAGEHFGSDPMDYTISNYIIPFLYITGDPPADRFSMEWEAVSDDGTVSNDRPSSLFEPVSPEGEGSDIRTGLVRGNVPDTLGITYSGTIFIHQEI